MSGKTVIAEGRFLRLVDEDGWEFAERRNVSGVVVIVAVTPEDEILFVEQFRPAVAGRVLELPAGMAGDLSDQRDESLEVAARRELLEETGYEAESWQHLAVGPPTSGLSSELVTLYRASGLTRVCAGGGDASEDISVHRVRISEAANWLSDRAAAGVLIDPKVYAGLFFATST